MQRLVIYYLKRKKWGLLLGCGYFISLYWFMSFAGEDGSWMRDPRFINFMFLCAVLNGCSFIPTLDTRFGAIRVIQTLPFSARELGIASWLV